MRIISGKYKGHKFTPPKNLPVRPTTDLAKESLFNILNNHFYFDEISVMDLFAGTGSISFEFASRGVRDIYTVDKHYNCIKFIYNTSKKFNMPVHTYKSDVFSFLEKTSLKTDIIFADPPYDLKDEKFLNIITIVFANKLLQQGGLLIIEHSKHTDLSTHKNFSYSKKYGGSIFSFFENEVPAIIAKK